MSFSVAPNLEGLAALARTDGLDMRPILVRVLTDLYVQETHHTREQEDHYVALMLRFLDSTDVTIRSTVARKLSDYPGAPAAVLRVLARDLIEVAEPVLLHAKGLSAADLEAIAAECGYQHRAAVQRRLHGSQSAAAPRVDAESRDHDDMGSDRSNVMNVIDSNHPARDCREEPEPAFSHPVLSRDPPSVRPSDRRIDPIVRPHAAAAQESPPAAIDRAEDAGLGERFLRADTAQREEILYALTADPRRPRTQLPFAEDGARRLEAAALKARPEDFARELSRLLSIPHPLAVRLVQDQDGEALLVALKALDLEPSRVLRVLLFLSPRIGGSVERVYELTQAYERMDARAALRIVISLQEPDETRPAARQSSLAADPHRRGPRELQSALETSFGSRPFGRRSRAGQSTT